MGWLTIALRRSLWLVVIGAAGGAAWQWRRDAADASSPTPAEWPPLTTTASTPAPAQSPAQSSAISPAPAASSSNVAASVVNALVDAPEARSTDGVAGGWTMPLPDGSCPLEHPIKANDNSGIFHLPAGRFYGRTKPERCYSNAEAAIADGYRQAKN